MILIFSPGARTPINVVDGVPDLTAFSEPTLSILQSAYDAGDYEIIPDPEPYFEPPKPNYPAFNIYMLMNTDNAEYKVLVNQINPDLVNAVALTYNNIVDRGTEDFKQIFSLFCQVANVSSDHRNQWADKAAELKLPADFVNTIRGTH